MPGDIPYMPGTSPAQPGLLSRYLPPIPEGIAARWLSERAPAGAWVLDPFGASPMLAIEAARSGYRVLAVANNPVTRFLLELAARPPQDHEWSAALAGLAATYVGDERTEPHLRSLYLTECAACGQEVMAEAFLWERDAPAPYARIYTCAQCGDAGEREATGADARRAAQFAGNPLHRARALERVAGRDDPDRVHAEEALSAYLPRAVYALFTLINKLDSLPAHQRPLVEALLLAACDTASKLWPHPPDRSLPDQLNTPLRFRENNVWLALEAAVNVFAPPGEPGKKRHPQTTLYDWPNPLPGSGGISLFEGRLKDLADMGGLEGLEAAAVLAALPRPNQAFWTLSALWSGWIWGREAAAPFKNVLRRRRYDWSWHTTALHAALSAMSPYLSSGVPILGLAAPADAEFLTAALLAARQAGCSLDGLALRPELAQIHWQMGPPAPRPVEMGAQETEGKPGSSIFRQVQEISRAEGKALLEARREPAGYVYLHAAALSGVVRSAALDRAGPAAPAEAYDQVQEAVERAFSYRGGFLHLGGSERSPESGRWWLRSSKRQPEPAAANDLEEAHLPLADRVEMALVRLLQGGETLTSTSLDEAICRAFPGLLTPEPGLVQAVLDSYAERPEQELGSEAWRLPSAERPAARRSDLDRMRKLLARLGGLWGYRVTDPASGSGSSRAPLVWSRTPGKAGSQGEDIAFFITASAVLGRILLARRPGTALPVLVFPSRRAGLIAHKLQGDPRLQAVTARGWRFINFQQLSQIVENARLDPEYFIAQLSGHPSGEGEPEGASS